MTTQDIANPDNDFEDVEVLLPPSGLPAEGLHNAVLTDYHDYGWLVRTYQDQDKGISPVVQPIFQLETRDCDGQRFVVTARTYHVLWSANANWYGFLCRLIGTKAVDDIIASKRCNLKQFLGLNCQVQIEHEEKTDANNVPRKYAKIINVMPVGNNTPLIEPENYLSARSLLGYLPPRPSAFKNNPEKAVSSAPVFVRKNGALYIPRGEYSSYPDLDAHVREIEAAADGEAAEGANGEVAPDETAPQNAPASREQIEQLKRLAKELHGDAEGSQWLRSKFGQNVPSEHVASQTIEQLKEELRRAKAAKAVANGEDPEYDDSDPFGDE